MDGQTKVTKLVLRQPGRFAELVECLWSEDPIVWMRAADAAEKVSAMKTDLLKPYKLALLGLPAEADQIELRWHLATMVPRLSLTGVERQRAAAALLRYLEDRSSIVKTFALQGLVDLARKEPNLLVPATQALEQSLLSGKAAMRVGARKLLKELKN